ncbi:MAG: fumarate hydratase [Lachnospiraceae bacterium]|nr:fumarate hydratase [Lachnospiraceae bacterium]
MNDRDAIIDLVKHCLIKASSDYRRDKCELFKEIINDENNEIAHNVLCMIDKNYEIAADSQAPLCDDTGIPHLILEIGTGTEISADTIDAIYEGVKQGLDTLPGRPMAVLGTDSQRIDQSKGLSDISCDVEPAPILMVRSNENKIRLHVLMLGGGPAIRGITYRVFHKHSLDTVVNQIVEWARDATEKLGCTPSTLAVGIGRSQYEASSMMLMAMVEGRYDKQSDLEKRITKEVNESGAGPLGVGGKHTVLATFLKVGPQRASGVRIVCLRPCCCFEPRVYSVDL